MFKRMFPKSAMAAAPTHPQEAGSKGAIGWHDKMRGAIGTAVIGGAAALIGAFEVGTTGAINSGTIPPTSVFTPLKTWVQTNFLGSDLVLVVGFISLIALGWALMHGKGWGGASAVLGILAVMLLGPNLVVAAATATRDPLPIVERVDQASHSAAPAAKTAVLVVKSAMPGARV